MKTSTRCVAPCLATCLALLASGAGDVRRARACSPAAPAQGITLPEAVPANGALTVFFQGGVVPDPLDVVDTITERSVAGRIVNVRRGLDALWKPDAPLVEGRLYEIRNAGPADPGRTSLLGPMGLPAFMAGPRAELTADAVAIASAELVPATTVVDAIECTGPLVASPTACEIRAPSVVLRQRTRALLAIRMQVPDVGSQFLVSPTLFADGERVAQLDWHWMYVEYEFPEVASEYCYELRVWSLLDDSEATLRGCLPGDERFGDEDRVGESGTVPDLLVWQLARCDGVQDPADQPLWCRAQALQCTLDPDEEACLATLTDCTFPDAGASLDAGVPSEADSRAKQADAGALVNVGVEADAPADDDASSDGASSRLGESSAEPEGDASSTSSCSAYGGRPAPAHASASVSLLGLCALVALRARSRRRPRRRDGGAPAAETIATA